MASEFPRVPIGDLVERGQARLQTGPFGSQLHKHDYVGEGIAVIPTEGIGRGRIIADASLPMINKAKAEELSRHRLMLGDILFARRGIQATGLSAIVGEQHVGSICGTGALLLRVDPDAVDPKFLAAYLSTAEAFDWLRTNAVGAVMPNLNTSIISRLLVPMPPKEVQGAVGYFVGCLDDRIDLLRQTNTTLDSLAHVLFKSWFVDFDPVRAKAEGREPEGMDAATAALFPSEFEESELGLIPKGWATTCVYRLATFINGAAYKAFAPNSEKRGLPIIKIAELKAGITSQTAHSEVEMPATIRIDTRDVLFSWSGNPDTSIDTFVWSNGPALLNQHIFRVVNDLPHERSFVLMTLKYLRPAFAEMARNKQTTGLGHVTVADLKETRFIAPNPEIVASWSRLVDPMLEKVLCNQLQIQSLSSLRDTLLPRLISGELRLPVAKAAILDAMQ